MIDLLAGAGVLFVLDQSSKWMVQALLDVLRRRSVLDFIDLRWWPVFNIADVGIVAGLAVAFWPAV